jgi:hypothetical protein
MAYGKVTMNEELEDMRKEKAVGDFKIPLINIEEMEMKTKIISYDSR